MSRSRKKYPSCQACSRRGITRAAQKKAERRAVNVALSKGEWDVLPKRKEVGPTSCCTANKILNKSHYDWEIQYTREIYEEAEELSMYVMEEVMGQPYDDLREWRNAFFFFFDEKLPWSYTWLYGELYTWFPIFNDRPVDPRRMDEDYLIDFYRRK